MNKINDWINSVMAYPPGTIYAGKAVGKQEKSAQAICEELYRFNHGKEVNVLGELRSAWRDVQVVNNLDLDIKPEYLAKVYGEFYFWSSRAVVSMDTVFKKHQDVWKYYQEFRLSFKNISDEIFAHIGKDLNKEASIYFIDKKAAE